MYEDEIQNIGANERREANSVNQASANEPRILIGKAVVSAQPNAQVILAEVFTMTLGDETIQLLPLKTWSQLDIFKWRARGILPATPAGLEIALDHVKVAGETVSTWDPDGGVKLEKAFNDWLALEHRSLEELKQKAQSSKAESSCTDTEEDWVHFRVEMKAGQAHIRCLEGNKMVKDVGLNPIGFNALIEQKLMRRPQSLKVGAMHDWVELDGELFRVKEGGEGAAELEQALNERYSPRPEADGPPDVVVLPNPASPTGFDIQFPATPNGLVETRRQHLTQSAIELLQDPRRCRVLRKGTIAKLAPPNLIFKRETADGGERNLAPRPDNVVTVTNEDGRTKIIDLSQPVNLLEVDANELATVFNHPAVNRRARLAQAA